MILRQRTLARLRANHDLSSQLKPRVPLRFKGHDGSHRVHYRIVLGNLGKPITSFDSTRQIFQVMRDALAGDVSVLALTAVLYKTDTSIAGHKGAYENANYLQGDMGIPNLVIARDGSGKLIDWDN